MEKYIGKYRVIIISTPSKENIYYKNAINQLDKKQFDMLSTLIKNKKSNKFSIKLYGLDGEKKYETFKFTSKFTSKSTSNTWTHIIKLIKNMPMQKEINKQLTKLTKLTLYADYHPESSTKNLGFKNKEVAKNTLKIIKNKSLIYQFQVVNTMYYRAKYHPHRTNEMLEAMRIFKKWLNNYKKNM